MSGTAVLPAPCEQAFVHEALFYRGEDEWLAGTVPFISEGVDAGEPVLVVVAAERIAALRAELDGRAEAVSFADMAEIGLNPARIIPAWREFLDRHGNGARPVRGIGEPIWANRSADELVECQRHEALLNVAFASSGAWRLLCPYDIDALDPAVIEEAQRSHPVISDADGRRPSGLCLPLDDMAAPFDQALPDPPGDAARLVFQNGDLRSVRAFITQRATDAQLPTGRLEDLVLAVNELATNSLRHGGGRGELRAWKSGDSLVCEIRDNGRIQDPLAGRQRPVNSAIGGRGLWIANQLCELVQMRCLPNGNVIRLHMRIRP